jgi:isopenicillin N synthase-like dioxygenase
MTTTFSSLPIVSLSILSDPNPTHEALLSLSAQLDSVFSTTGFAYLVDLPITYSHEEVFDLCDDFFGPEGLRESEKKKLAKNSFEKRNPNTYRGYVPCNPLLFTS